MKRLLGIIFLCLLAAGQLWADNIVDGKPADGNAPPPCHNVTISGTHVSCYGGANGTATVSLSNLGGSPGPFLYSWSTGATTTSISNLTAGYYDVQVIDQSTGCTAFDIFEVTEPPLISTSVVIANVNCNGQSTGSINLIVNGGTPGYLYNWSNGAITQDVNSLAAGTYYVTITDNNSCTAIDSATITEPNTALNSSFQAYDITCNGFADGSVNITAWGGSPPYNYNWSNGALTEDVNGLSVGSYTVTITDDKGCISLQSAFIGEPLALSNTAVVTDANCYGSSDGGIDITVTGGVQPYSFEWENSNYQLSYNQEDLINFGAETYVVIIRDSNMCMLTDTLIVSSPPQIQLSFVTSDVTSNGGTDGAIDLSVVGGVPTYTYLWSNGMATQDLSNITAGVYSVTVTDAQSCFVTDSVEVFEPLLPLDYQLVTRDVTCHGGNDGEIYLFAEGGVPPYTYYWSSTDTVPILTDLVAGQYIFTITDANGINLIDTVNILQPFPIALAYTHTDVSCNGFSDGSVDLVVSGGTAPYTYAWYDSDYILAAITQDVFFLPADTFRVIVTDTNGCTNSTMVVISQPDRLTLSITSDDVECFGGSTGNIDLEVTGGTYPYAYLWSNGATTQDLTSIMAGTYSVTVTDGNGCFDIAEVEIGQADSMSTQFYVVDVSCIDNFDGEVTVYTQGGTGMYDYIWSTGETANHIEGLYEGWYTVTITDIYDCEHIDSAYVGRNMVECINIPSAFTPNADAYNDTWILGNIDLYPDCTVKVYNRWGKFVFESTGYDNPWDGKYEGNPMPSGTYYYIIKLREDYEPKTGTVTIVR